MDRLSRPMKMPDGSIKYVSLPVCECGDKQRGPANGVCGNCGDAIRDISPYVAPKEQQASE